MPPKVAVLIAVTMLLTASASAQAPAATANAQGGPQEADGHEIPRLSDGRPNFQGIWYIRPWQDPAKAVANGGQFFSNLVPEDGGPLRAATPGRGASSPPAAAGRGGGRPHYLPEAAAIQQELQQHHLFEDPEGLCQLPGVPRAFFTPPYPTQFIQDEKYLTILLEYVEDSRIIPITNTPHPTKYWSWNGDSRAHWEGDTLVVDVANFNGRAWLDPQGDFFDENLHVVERFSLSGPDTIAYEVTATDPTTFAEPWTNRRTFYRQPETEQLLEYSCKEGERSIQHYTEDQGGKAPVKEGKTR